MASYLHEDMPTHLLEAMNLRQRLLDSVPGGPLGRALASRWLRGKSTRELAKLIRERAPKDAREQWQKVAAADGLAFIAPVFWLHFPAILKGWFERVFAYGSAYALTRQGWEGHASGRVPLMQHGKALVITPTLFCERLQGRLGAADAPHHRRLGAALPGRQARRARLLLGRRDRRPAADRAVPTPRPPARPRLRRSSWPAHPRLSATLLETHTKL